MEKELIKEIGVDIDMERKVVRDFYINGELFPYKFKSLSATEDFQSVPEVTITIPCGRINIVRFYGDHDDKKD